MISQAHAQRRVTIKRSSRIVNKLLDTGAIDERQHRIISQSLAIAAESEGMSWGDIVAQNLELSR